MNVLIVAGGKKPSLELLHKYKDKCDFIIAADSGADILKQEKITYHLLLGDFDSVKDRTVLKEDGHEILVYKCEKDFSDTEAAVREAIKLKPVNIYLLGATGTRMDHFLSNLNLLRLIKENKIHGEIIDENNRIYLIDQTTIIKKDSPFISFSAFLEDVEGFSLEGFKYPLKYHKLRFGESLTVSNEILESHGKVSFPKGLVLVNHSRD